MDRFTATSSNYDLPVSPLVGNGWMATTLGPNGYHHPPNPTLDNLTDKQILVAAGHRLPGARHELISFGVLSRELKINGAEPETAHWEQSVRPNAGEVRSRLLHNGLLESTRTLITLQRNLLYVETTLHNQTEETQQVEFNLSFHFADRTGSPNPDLKFEPHMYAAGCDFHWECGDNVGELRFHAGAPVSILNEAHATAKHKATLDPDETVKFAAWVELSSRLQYQWPVSESQIEDVLQEHQKAWSEFWRQTDLKTGVPEVDEFRIISLYTLRCQSTPWSIPASLSRPHWGGGAFHDEMYPFLGLLSGGYRELAEKIPYYRLTTLPKAIERARSKGALYPWSATEFGEERDPHGHWYTERFHLGQFAACVWFYWLYTRDRVALGTFYPVLREMARFFQLNLVERGPDGNITTKPCTDFDESVGEVRGGPFTVSAAIFSLEKAAQAAKILGRDGDVSGEWERLGNELRKSLPVDREEGTYAIPQGKSLHSSILGPIAPFFVDVTSETAERTRELIHAQMRSNRGFKPGLNEVFEGSNWMWASGHLAMAHAAAGDGERAWDAIQAGPLAASAFYSPNEHLDKHENVKVPWFTTGCGGWLCGLHWSFALVDDHGSHLLPAVSSELTHFSFRGLRLGDGVSVSAEVEGDAFVSLAFHSERHQAFSFTLPRRFGDTLPETETLQRSAHPKGWLVTVELTAGENVVVKPPGEPDGVGLTARDLQSN